MTCTCKPTTRAGRKGLDPTGCPLHGDHGSVLRGHGLRDRVLKHGVGYDLIVRPEETRLVLAIRCQTCQRVSFHPKDITERYCGACHVFHEDRLLSHEA